jgi:hypothetical protein
MGWSVERDGLAERGILAKGHAKTVICAPSKKTEVSRRRLPNLTPNYACQINIRGVVSDPGRRRQFDCNQDATFLLTLFTRHLVCKKAQNLYVIQAEK